MASFIGPTEALARSVDIARARRGRTVLIGVDGWGGSGKTTLAARIAAAVPDTVVVHIDDFASPRISGWDHDRFETQVLAPLRGGRQARYQRWDWPTDSGAEWHDVPAGVPVVVEGVSATRREVDAAWDLTMWVEAPLDIRLDRALARDGPAMMDRWLTDWIPSEQAWVARQDPLSWVDLRVSGIAEAVSVRPATAFDVAALRRDLPGTAASVWTAHLRRHRAGDAVLLVAEVGPRIVATVLAERGGPRSETFARAVPGVPALSNLAVGPSCRGHGIAGVLLAAGESLLAEEGARQVLLAVGTDNAPARRAYLRAGYERTGLEARSSYDWLDADGVEHHTEERDELLVKALPDV